MGTYTLELMVIDNYSDLRIKMNTMLVKSFSISRHGRFTLVQSIVNIKKVIMIHKYQSSANSYIHHEE